MGIISKIILIPLIIIGGLLILAGVGAVYFIGWDNITDFLTTEEVEHNCDINNNTCLDSAIAGKWVAHGCGEIIFGDAKMNLNATPEKAVCAGTNVIFPEGEPSTSEAIELAKKKIKFYCCDAESCIEEKTYYVIELMDYFPKEEAEDISTEIKQGIEYTNNLITEFKKEVSCIESIGFGPKGSL